MFRVGCGFALKPCSRVLAEVYLTSNEHCDFLNCIGKLGPHFKDFLFGEMNLSGLLHCAPCQHSVRIPFTWYMVLA